MKKRQTLEEMAADMYDDGEVAQAVVEDADRLGTRDRILSGELVLPHPADAVRWHDRKQGREEMTPKERVQEQIIHDQEARLSALEAQMTQKGGS